MESSQDGLDIDMAFAQLNLEAPNVQLSAEQQQTLDAIFKGRNVFCTGAAGTGKSEVLRSAFKTLTSAGKRVGLAAPTGIVAESIGGTTIHSLFGIGVPQTATEFRHRMHKPDVQSRLQTLDILVIDEISCVSGELLDRLDVEIRELRGSDAPFGGIQLVFFGDFMQLPPVSATMKMRDDHGSGFCPSIFTSRGEAFQSRLWAEANFVTCSLSENYRQLGDDNSKFRELLEKLRHGVDMTKTQREIQELCSIDSADGKGPVVLCSKNSEVESVNNGTFEELDGDPESFT